MNRACFLLLAFALLFFTGCHEKRHREVLRSFYYWRTVFELQPQEQSELREMNICRIYARFFDVGYDKQKEMVAPIQDIRFRSVVDSSLEVVPVVFLTNEALSHTADSATGTLAQLIANRILETDSTLLGQHLKEVQLDCDWTEKSRILYFHLVESMKSLLHPRGIVLSVTIRLHQVKYYQRTGVPPADRGMLMYYNMGKLASSETKNSIYDPETAAAYLVHFADYPLPLDVALPCFSWVVVLKDNKLAGLIHEVKDEDLAAESNLQRMSPGKYKVNTSFKWRNQDLLAGETLRLEEVEGPACLEAAAQIEPLLKESKIHVSIFHLQKNQYTSHEKQTIEAVYHCFN
jgi:hypothetical protein